MWKTINDVLANIDDLVWGVPLMVLIRWYPAYFTSGTSPDP